MKKMHTRFLSLALVLILVISVLPAALATENETPMESMKVLTGDEVVATEPVLPDELTAVEAALAAADACTAEGCTGHLLAIATEEDPLTEGEMKWLLEETQLANSSGTMGPGRIFSITGMDGDVEKEFFFGLRYPCGAAGQKRATLMRAIFNAAGANLTGVTDGDDTVLTLKAYMKLDMTYDAAIFNLDNMTGASKLVVDLNENTLELTTSTNGIGAFYDATAGKDVTFTNGDITFISTASTNNTAMLRQGTSNKAAASVDCTVTYDGVNITATGEDDAEAAGVVQAVYHYGTPKIVIKDSIMSSNGGNLILFQGAGNYSGAVTISGSTLTAAKSEKQPLYATSTAKGKYFTVTVEASSTPTVITCNSSLAAKRDDLPAFINGSVSANTAFSYAGCTETYTTDDEAGTQTYTYAKEVKTINFAGDNMTLGHDLALNFLIKKADMDGETVADYYVVFTQEGKDPVTVTGDKWIGYTEEDEEYWLVPYTGIAAKEMTDEVTAQLYNDEAVAVNQGMTSSVKAYAQWFIDNSSDANLKAMLEAMLAYGAAAQTYFGYKTDNLADQ